MARALPSHGRGRWFESNIAHDIVCHTPEMGEGTHLGDGMFALDDEECWDLLADEEVGRLAVSIGNHPDIFPINYVVDAGDDATSRPRSIVFRTAAGTKLAAAVLGEAVAFEIDGYNAALGDAWSVVVKGTARQIEHMIEYYEAEELPLFPWHAGPKYDFVRIEVDEITGRRFQVVDR